MLDLIPISANKLRISQTIDLQSPAWSNIVSDGGWTFAKLKAVLAYFIFAATHFQTSIILLCSSLAFETKAARFAGTSTVLGALKNARFKGATTAFQLGYEV